LILSDLCYIFDERSQAAFSVRAWPASANSGEIWTNISTTALTTGYHREPELGADLWRDGYLHTGDIANVDENGFIQITDRLKDVIKSGGEWISSIELEDLVSQLVGVGEVAAIGVPHEKWGERPLVLIVPAGPEPENLWPEKVRAHLRNCADRGKISKWAVPDDVFFVDAIDKTSVGKIDKKALREKYAQR
jgi:fatty-acyl-CoA synthase